MEIDGELTDGVVKGFNIEAIMGVVEKHIKKPVVVEDLLGGDYPCQRFCERGRV